MQTYPRDLLSQAPARKPPVVAIVIAAIAVFMVVTFCAATWFTYVFFFRTTTGPKIELVGRWKQEQPLGDAAGSSGRKIWIYNFFTWGEFQVHAELQVPGKPWQNITSDSKGHWTLSANGNLKMTFADDGKTESVMLTRLTDKKVAVDKGSTRTFLERME